jgi:hypothetical protein
MKILIACEESQAVTKELRRLGHEAYSCDIIDQSGGHPEWHIKQDVLPLLNGRCKFQTTDGSVHHVPGRWDALIAFPPCTDLANSGARHFAKKRADGRQRKSVLFFCEFLAADCDIIIIENPVGIMSGEYVRTHFPDIAEKYNLPRKPTQTIQPWQFALSEEEFTEKSTCLWIMGRPAMVPIRSNMPNIPYKEFKTTGGRTKRQTLWYYNTRCLPKAERAQVASKTFPGIARAIANQIIGPRETTNTEGELEEWMQ